MFLLVLFVIVLVFAVVCIVIVPENNEFVVEQLGKYHKTLKAGVNLEYHFYKRWLLR